MTTTTETNLAVAEAMGYRWMEPHPPRSTRMVTNDDGFTAIPLPDFTKWSQVPALLAWLVMKGRAPDIMCCSEWTKITFCDGSYIDAGSIDGVPEALGTEILAVADAES